MSFKTWLSRLVLVVSVSAGVTAFAAAPAEQSPAGPPKGADTSAAPVAVRRIPDTLMFTIDELTDIQSRISSASAAESSDKGQSDAIESAALYLSTIVYYGPQNWTIWVNGKPIGPEQDFQSFKVTDIGPRFVEFLVPLSAQGMRPVRLEPNQTFIAKSGAVVEGAWKP